MHRPRCSEIPGLSMNIQTPDPCEIAIVKKLSSHLPPSPLLPFSQDEDDEGEVNTPDTGPSRLGKGLNVQLAR